MAVLFRRLRQPELEYEDVGVVIDRECYGEPSHPDHPVQRLNLEFEGWEEELADEYNSKRYHATVVDDDEVDVDEFEKLDAEDTV